MAKYADVEILKSTMLENVNIMAEVLGDENADSYVSVNHVIDLIDGLPTADVQEVRHGHWISEHIGYGVTRYKCSVCGGRFGIIEDFPPNNFCPNCGARMDEKDGDKNA